MNNCKASHKVKYVMCKKRIKAHTPKEYIKEILSQGKDIDTIGKVIGMNSKTVKSMLYENKDMSFELYEKLEKLLFNN